LQILRIEPTPNPNNMKLTTDRALAHGVRHTFTAAQSSHAPPEVGRLLEIDGVRSVFMTGDFVTIQRDPRADWQIILTLARRAFGSEEGAREPAIACEANADWNEVRVTVQYFRGIPMLCKLTSNSDERRVALPKRFGAAVEEARASSANMLLERRWRDEGVRYGDLEGVAQSVSEEFALVYDDKRLDCLVGRAFAMGKELDADAPATTASVDELRRDLASEDWKTRLIAMKQLGADGVPPDALLAALSDARMAVRRMAVVYLGMVKDKSFDAVPALCKALSDEAVAVRRTAGDALTDLGDARAMGPLTRCLQDSNKLVRWRAARFLYEHGNAGALEALEDASGDGEYEVSMQIRQAIERIEGGHAAQGTVWQQMTENPDT
jgi:hypothetical protein